MKRQAPFFICFKNNLITSRLEIVFTRVGFMMKSISNFFLNKLNKVVGVIAAISAVFLFLILPSTSYAVTADITSIGFITTGQTVKPGEVSKVITVYAFNSAGTKEDFDTSGAKLEIISDSPTGQFSTNGTSWDFTNPLTINKTWYGRNVYYKDLSTGSFVLSAKITAGSSVWSVSQGIRIGEEISTTTDNTGDIASTSADTNGLVTATSTATTTIQNQASTTTVTIYRYISVHSNSSDLSTQNNSAEFSVSAGRDRLAYVDCPVKFAAKISGSNSTNMATNMWSFGDGAVSGGEVTEHVYKYPGVYNVVLNTRMGDKEVTARSSVKVISPEVSLMDFNNESFDIKNKGSFEINLNNWSVSAGTSRYVFPLDTIVGAGQVLRVPFEYSKLTLSSEVVKVSLLDPTSREKSYFSLNKNSMTGNVNKLTEVIVSVGTTTIETVPNIKLSEAQIQTLINELTKVTASALVTNKVDILVSKESLDKESVPLKDVGLEMNEIELGKGAVASVLKAFSDDKITATSVEKSGQVEGFWTSIWTLPSRTWKGFANFFYPSLNTE
ncbi:MAG: PKD domain-containing protein [bacterium]